jgi:RES domain-containing protein
MVVYRITLAKWADKLTGSGYPARWNDKGYYVIYTAESRALACLENLVHRSGEGLNESFRFIEIDIPDSVSANRIYPEKLPADWHLIQGYPACQTIGKRWLENQKSCILKVPSSIIEAECNILINPNHPEFKQISIRNTGEFSFDDRLKSG